MIDPRKVHDMEQDLARIRDIAAKVAAYYLGLRDAGVSAAEASSLVIGFLSVLMWPTPRPPTLPGDEWKET